MSTKSMTDIAYDIISNRKVTIQFSKLWEYVSKEAGVSNDKIGQFYNDLSLDSRFVSLKDNRWDLKSRRTFDETHVDIAEIEVEDDEEEEKDINDEEEESPLAASNSEDYY